MLLVGLLFSLLIFADVNQLQCISQLVALAASS